MPTFPQFQGGTPTCCLSELPGGAITASYTLLTSWNSKLRAISCVIVEPDVLYVVTVQPLAADEQSNFALYLSDGLHLPNTDFRGIGPDGPKPVVLDTCPPDTPPKRTASEQSTPANELWFAQISQLIQSEFADRFPH